MLQIRYRYCWVVLSVLVFLSACGKKESFSPDDNDGVQIANRVSIFESKDNQKQWLLTAEAVDFADLTRATLKNPKLQLKQNGADSAVVTADTGTFDYPNKIITVEGNAQINSLTEQLKITTERFFYDVNQDKFGPIKKQLLPAAAARPLRAAG